ncbi:MAG: hypothetical protein DYG89_17995 [Caldilinea sp. CFX5]|nr:hypothetical protein [Caldilinea sp. CFX5]
MSNNRPPFTGQAERGFAEDCATFAIGGTIWREVQSNDGVQRRPWPRVSVQIKETGRFAETDAQGRFRFYGLQPGDYWLVVRQKAIPPQNEGALLKEERITVAWPPSYDVTVPVIYREAAVLTTDVTGAPTSNASESPHPTPPQPGEGTVVGTTVPPLTRGRVGGGEAAASSGQVGTDDPVDGTELPGRLTAQLAASQPPPPPAVVTEEEATVAEAEKPPVAPATESAPPKKPTRKRSSSTAATPPKGASEP